MSATASCCAAASANCCTKATSSREHDKVFWLQLVGTGLTATLALHLAAVCTHARWPAVSCHNLYEHTLLKEPIRVHNGYARIPTGPGLGVEVDPDAVERFRIEPIAKPYPYPGLLMRLRWPTGAEDHYAHGLQYWDDFISGRRPVFTPGVRLDIVPNDGSAEWQRQYQEALKKPSYVMKPN
jgi:hypothetical protein